jgi:carbon storage regulator
MVRSPFSRFIARHRHCYWKFAVGSGLSDRATLQGGSAVILISRTKDESIVLGDDVILTVIEIRGDKVRLAIEHPKGVTVHRQEVYEAICRAEQREPIVMPSSEG